MSQCALFPSLPQNTPTPPPRSLSTPQTSKTIFGRTIRYTPHQSNFLNEAGPSQMKQTKSLAAATVTACLIALACHSLSHPVAAAAAAAKPAADGVLLESMDAELHRAMSALGSATDSAQPKP